MARLSIGVERLGAEGFRLELGGKDGATNLVALAPGGGIRGRYEQDDAAIGLRALRADTLALSEFRWQLSNGQVELAAPSQLREVEIEATIARGDATPKFVGAIRAAAVDATVNITLGGLTIQGATLRIQSFEFTASPDGKVAVRFGQVSAATLEVLTRGMQLSVADVLAAGPCTIDPAGLRIESLDVGRVTAKLPDLTSKAADAAPTTPKGPRTLPNLPFLPHLHGKIAVDVIPDVTLPIIGSRKATHAFRIPVEGGIIKLGDVESGLSTLENLVIDFEVEDGKLVLEKDIPLIPFDNKPLVEWKLDGPAQALANDKRVALSTLMQATLPASAKKEADAERKKKGKAIDLRRLDLANIDVDLRCAGTSELAVAGGTVRLGDAQRPAIGELRVTGNLTHVPGDPSPGQLSLTAKNLLAGLDGVSVGDRTLTVSEVGVGAIDGVTVAFAGVKPQSAEARASGLTLRGVHLGPR